MNTTPTPASIEWAADVVVLHLDSPEVRAWRRQHPDAGAEEVLSPRENWSDVLPGTTEEDRDAAWAAMVAAAEEILAAEGRQS